VFHKRLMPSQTSSIQQVLREEEGFVFGLSPKLLEQRTDSSQFPIAMEEFYKI